MRTDRDGRLTFLSDVFERAVGGPAADFLGTPFSSLRKPRKNGSFDFANRPMSTEPCPPHRTAHMAIAKIS